MEKSSSIPFHVFPCSTWFEAARQTTFQVRDGSAIAIMYEMIIVGDSAIVRQV